jgi:hypothetical protein
MATLPSIVPTDLCLVFEEVGLPDDICFPGGFCLSYIWDAIGKIPHASDLPLDFFSQIGPAMAPLKPFFDILDTALAIFKCVSAVPDAITELDPTKLFQCMPDLVKAINNLLKLIPMLSLPRMVKAIIHNLAKLLRGVAGDLRYIEAQIKRIAEAIDEAADLQDVTLNGLLSCSQKNVEQTVMTTADALKGIGRIILVINILMGLFGGPEIPCFGAGLLDAISEGFDVIVEFLTMLAALLDEIANSIPDLDLVLTLALGKAKC